MNYSIINYQNLSLNTFKDESLIVDFLLKYMHAYNYVVICVLVDTYYAKGGQQIPNGCYTRTGM